jgi:hypothetical protein
VLASHIVKRLLEPEDVAEVVAILADPAGSGSTGRPSRWTSAGSRADRYQNDRSVPGLILLTRKLRKKKPK